MKDLNFKKKLLLHSAIWLCKPTTSYHMAAGLPACLPPRRFWMILMPLSRRKKSILDPAEVKKKGFKSGTWWHWHLKKE
jgi:hypothetical protein